jgi:2-phosphoglycerate kinase
MSFESKNIIIYGVPGSGKTTLATRLAKKFGVPHLEADAFRSIAQKGKVLPKSPFHFLATTEAYQAIGKRTKDNIIAGLLNVRKALHPTIAKQLKKYRKGFVLEAAFLDPKRLLKTGQLLLVAPPLKDHRRQFFVHRKNDAFHRIQFKNARVIQQFLIAEAKRFGVPITRNGNRI